ncbi:uncharacterized protein LOC126910302 isoform X2 [Daktulosphaira vitifoliae]|uniref:uncharacterized protein LOC126910302 isoform X2 n=1 Tax=Daktulosphaira vitifoliae TaxID=58002 RepID=UPI0021A97C84|nr:uncharacterized protein LOC126910302 isoform X2 [Daktulosphaira vitifoliae]
MYLYHAVTDARRLPTVSCCRAMSLLLLLLYKSRRSPTRRYAKDAALFTVCLMFTFLQCQTTNAAIPLDEEKSKEYIISQLADIIEDQRNRILEDQNRHNYPQVDENRNIPRIRVTDKEPEFTYDSGALVEPEVNTGDKEVPFAVMPYNPRYYKPEYYNRLAVLSPNDKYYENAGKIHSVHTSKSKEVHDFIAETEEYKSKYTTENTSSVQTTLDITHSALSYTPFITSIYSKFSQNDYYFFAKAAGVGLAVLVVMVMSLIACYKMQKNKKLAADIDYPAYGITGPNKDFSPTGDRRLAQSAQMYHYQHQKQQIIAMESNNAVKDARSGSITDPDSDDDNEEGDYTVYECPGLAPAGEMEVKNPLFHDDNTPVSSTNNSKEDVRENGAVTTVPVP